MIGKALMTGGLIVMSWGAAAATGDPHIWQRMEQNGRITVSEIRDHSAQVFAALDRNGDGLISETELINENLPQSVSLSDDKDLRTQLFGRINSDGDQAISPAEWQGALDRDLGVADLNGNGTITLGELARVDAGDAFLNMLGF